METNRQTAAAQPVFQPGTDAITCPNCQTKLLRGMRFCRTCGYRLGEGVAEYAETMRFDDRMPPVATAAPLAATAQQTPAPPTTALPAPYTAPLARRARWCSMRGSNWLVWVMVAVIMVSAMGGSAWLRRVRQNLRGVAGSVVTPPRSFFGTSGFSDVDEGVMMDAVVPGSPAEQAGLIGGDIIQRFDGKRPEDADEMRRLLRNTPIGKAVEVVYLRDGASHTALLTTVSSELFNRDNDSLMYPAGRQGFLGVDDMERVADADEKLYGVRVGDVTRNRPADIAGLRPGDVITDFNGRPVRTEDELGAQIRRATPGQAVPVTLVRDGQPQTIEVKMGRR
ncbi:MAG TPA: PDZ domain-containing protein [Pyrinomonadaceae bacterium]|jgi:hypothetical protein